MNYDSLSAFAPGDDAGDASQPTHLAQAITCGRWPLAFSFAWASSIVDKIEMTKIPRAPAWLIGAVNVDGAIVPVVDLSVFFEPDDQPTMIGRQHRLLLGGSRGDDNENTIAVLFSGLPFQIEYSREAIDAATAIPVGLREICRGAARVATGKRYFEIDTERLAEVLSLSLADA